MAHYSRSPPEETLSFQLEPLHFYIHLNGRHSVSRTEHTRTASANCCDCNKNAYKRECLCVESGGAASEDNVATNGR